MSYTAIAEAAQDTALRDRIAAAVATQPHGDEHPLNVTSRIQWECAAQPGWGEAWESAIASGSPDPGSDPAVISDGMILAAVQQILAPPVAEGTEG